MGFLGWIILGGIAGAIAKKFLPGDNNPNGFFVTIAIGVAGGLLGGGIASLLFNVQMGSFFDIRSWAIAILGSIALLFAYHYVKTNMLAKDEPATTPVREVPGERRK